MGIHGRRVYTVSGYMETYTAAYGYAEICTFMHLYISLQGNI